MNVMTREKQTYQDIGEPKVRFGASMRKRGYFAGHRVCLILALAGLTCGLALPGYSWSQPIPNQSAMPLVTNPSWGATGNLNTPRYGHTATLLANGKVVVAGGLARTLAQLSVTDSAELYDPGTGTWSRTGNLNTGRVGHTATLLPNGKVLVAGGHDRLAPPFLDLTDRVELYDPSTGTWSSTNNLNTSRSGHTATLLPNGKVLVAGGVTNNGVLLDSAELYDPATGIWTLTDSLRTARSLHLATLLPSDKVLVAGGYINSEPYFLSSAEVYDPATGSWSSASNLNRPSADTTTLLPSGEVLVTQWDSAEFYDPATGLWSDTGNLNTAREAYTATLLPNGQVLVAGGYNYNDDNPFISAELYDPTTRIWSRSVNLNTGRYNHTATLLPDGKVLVAGGLDAFGTTLSSAELFDPGLTQTAGGNLN
jgi:galactose oxidase-like protein/Kelch motif protein